MEAFPEKPAHMQPIKILIILKSELQYPLSESTWHCKSDLGVKVYVKFHATYPQKHKGKTQCESVGWGENWGKKK